MALASSSVKDAYNGLKAFLQKRFGDQEKVKAAIKNVAEKPDNEVYQNLLTYELKEVGAGQDEEIVAKAKALLELLKNEGLISEAKYKATLVGNGAIAQGKGAVAGGKNAIVGGRDVNVKIQSPDD